MRLTLVHWNEAEAEERAVRIRSGGHTVAVYWDGKKGPAGLRRLFNVPPNAFVISLDRLPSQSVAVATWLRQQKATRPTPLVFAGGAPEKVKRARELLPDAGFAEWSNLEEVLREALRAAPRDPVVPRTMQGYSGTPLVKKLGLKPGQRVLLLGSPGKFEESLAPLPEGTILRKQARGTAAVVLLFVRSVAELTKRFDAAAATVAQAGRLWIIWPKKVSAMAADVGQNDVRRLGLERNWVDFKIAAIDETWSGLAFARGKTK